MCADHSTEPNPLRYHRKMAGLSLRELAQLAGTDPIFLRRVECGDAALDDLDRARLAFVLGCSPDALTDFGHAITIKILALFRRADARTKADIHRLACDLQRASCH